MNKHIRNFLNGLAFGITETIPGVSGGTIAIILDFYDELIRSINNFTKDYQKYLKFFIPLLIGAATGVLTFSSIASFLLTNYSFPTMLFFIGLVVGIIPHIYTKTTENGKWFSFKELLLIFIPFLALVLISGLKESSIATPQELIAALDARYMLFILFCGILGSAALVLPGVSGSFVLLLLGIYHLTTYSISSIKLLLTDFSNIALMIDICSVLVPLAIGMAIGGLSMTRLIEKLFKNYYKTTYLIILGLLFGSVYALFRDPIVYQSGVSTNIVLIGAVTFILGFAFSFILGKKQV